jgi:hypothetical protein
VLTTSSPHHALERSQIKLSIHEERTVKLAGNGFYIGLFEDEFTSALPMIAQFPVRR